MLCDYEKNFETAFIVSRFFLLGIWLVPTVCWNFMSTEAVEVVDITILWFVPVPVVGSCGLDQDMFHLVPVVLDGVFINES